MPILFNAALVRHDVPENARAILVIVHGMAEYAGRYSAVIEYLNRQGIGCVSFDQRGHGRSPTNEADRGDVEKFTDFVDDAVRVIEGTRAKYAALPLFVWGHSMGAIITTLAAGKLFASTAERLRGVITSGAPVASFDGFSPLMLKLLFALARLVPRKRMGRPFDPGRLSRDLEVGRRYAEDPLVPRTTSLRLLTQLARASKQCLFVAGKITTPWLLLHGTDDRVAPAIGSQRLFDALGSTDKQIRLWPGARHEVHNEIEPTRTEFLSCMAEWILARA